ncbi:NAD(P)/FAD-dependent oxidoreductase [Candidatus Nanosalina sp. VS9-1]|uniref:NAD(P)/FAD-dependent oxidoreductase n=1 Tax=Candidatus Nanosalina sp. VS9-1 TaxID=3388566 RepID=UPI0039E1A2CB
MSDRKFVVIGDGNAGATAAKKLREEDEEAEITVLTDESEPLYNRIMLKNYMKGTLPKQYARVHDEAWYEKRDIDLHLETRVTEVDTGEKKVETGDENFSYDRLLVATGGSPRKLPFDDGNDNVHYMWTMGDAERIKNDAEECEKAVVIGGGLLGIDLAVAYAENDAETYYLIRESNWWHRGLDEEGSDIVHRKLEEKGVNVMTETEASDFETEDGKVTAAVLDSGEKIECDSVAVAIGQTPNSEFINVEKTDGGLIRTDKYLKTSSDDVFAAGNMVEYYSPTFERRTVNGSWDHSEEMGECAAENMLGNEEAFDYVNTYGVGHFDVQFLAVGDWSGEALERKYSDDEYRRLFFDGDRLVGAVMIGFTRGQERIREMIHDKEEFDDREKLLEKSFWE